MFFLLLPSSSLQKEHFFLPLTLSISLCASSGMTTVTGSQVAVAAATVVVVPPPAIIDDVSASLKKKHFCKYTFIWYGINSFRRNYLAEYYLDEILRIFGWPKTNLSMRFWPMIHLAELFFRRKTFWLSSTANKFSTKNASVNWEFG